MAYRVYSVRMGSDAFDRINKYNEVRMLYGLKKVTIGEYITDAVKRCIAMDVEKLKEDRSKYEEKLIHELMGKKQT